MYDIERDEDFYVVRSLLNVGGLALTEALEDSVRAILVTQDFRVVRRLTPLVARVVEEYGAMQTWVLRAVASSVERIEGSVYRERKLLVQAIRLAGDEDALFERLHNLDEWRRQRALLRAQQSGDSSERVTGVS